MRDIPLPAASATNGRGNLVLRESMGGECIMLTRGPGTRSFCCTAIRLGGFFTATLLRR